MIARLRFSLFATLVLTAAAAAEPVRIGAVERVQEDVIARQAAAARGLHVADSLLFRDEVRTGAGARFEGKLADGTQLTLGEKGKLTIDDFVYSPDKTGGRLALSVTKGAFLFVGGKVEAPSGGHVEINTPIGTLGVRGTTFWGGLIDGGFGVLVVKGEVTLTTKRGVVDIKAGDGAMIYPGRKPRAPKPWPEDRKQRALATIRFK